MAFSINSVSFNNKGTITDYLLGNIGDRVTATIDFTSDYQIGQIQFLQNQIGNSVDLGDGSLITDDNFLNLATNNTERHTSNNIVNVVSTTSPLSFTQPKGSNLDNSVSILYVANNGATHDYRITAGFYIVPPRGEDVDINSDTYQTPIYFEAQECLKYIFRIVTSDNSLNPNSNIQNTDSLPLVNDGHIQLGNTGNFGESLNGNAEIYRLKSLSAEDFFSNENSRVSVRLEINPEYSSSLKKDALPKLVRQRVITAEEYDSDLDLRENLNYGELELELNVVNQNDFFENALFTLDGDDLLIEFDLIGQPDDNCLIWLSVYDDGFVTTGALQNPVYLTAKNIATFINQDGIDFIKNGNRFEDFNFFHDNIIDGSEAFNHDAIYIGKYSRFEAAFNVDSEINIQSVTFGLKDANNVVLEDFTTSNLNTTSNRAYNILNSEYNDISVSNSGSEYYFAYPFYLKEGYANLKSFVTFSYTRVIEGNNVNITANFESAEVETLTFYQDPIAHAGDSPTLTDFTDAAPTIPYAGTTPVLKFYSDSGFTTEINSLRIGGFTYCEATFVEQNSDLQVVDAGDLTVQCAINNLGGNEFTERYLHTNLNKTSESPLIGTADPIRPEVDIIGVDTVRIRFYVDNVKLANLYGTGKVNISVNLDNVQINEAVPYDGVFMVYNDNGDFLITEGDGGTRLYSGDTNDEDIPLDIEYDGYGLDGIPDPFGLTFATAINRYIVTSGDTAAANIGFYSDRQTLDLLKVWSDDAADTYSALVSYAAAKSDLIFTRSLISQNVIINAVDAYSGGTATTIDITDGDIINTTADGTSIETPQAGTYVPDTDELWIPCNGVGNSGIKIYDYDSRNHVTDIITTDVTPNAMHFQGFYFDGFFYVANRNQNRVDRYNVSTRALDASYTATGMVNPLGVSVDSNNIYVADSSSVKFFTIPL